MKNVTIPSQFLQELLALCGPEDHELRERVLKSAAPTHPAEGVPAQAPQNLLAEQSATYGMHFGDRVLHIGGRENAAGYIEFGSVEAVRVLVGQVLRDLPGGAPGFELSATHPTHQGLEQAIEWPKARDVGRFGDMSPDAFIRVGLDADNDVYVSICDGNSVSDIEFCTPGGGGGRSSRTRMALIALMCAIEADNASHPSFDFWQHSIAAQAKQGEQANG